MLLAVMQRAVVAMRSQENRRRCARRFDDAGAFAIVLEGVLEPIAIEATKSVESDHHIGIGAITAM